MNLPAGAVKTLEITKVRSFETELRAAIRSEFGTNRQFGVAVGLSEGRVSQILSGSEVVTQHSLALILTAFSTFMIRERLHEAWVSTFVASPLEKLEEQELTVRCDQFLSNLKSLVSSGRAKHCLDFLSSLRKEALDQERKLRVEYELINLNLYLGRPSTALILSRKMTEDAHRLGLSNWTAAGLYTSTSATRNSPNLTPKQILLAHNSLVQFVAAWNPCLPEDQTYRTELQAAIVRDQVLTILALSSGTGNETCSMRDAESMLTKAIRQEESESSKIHALEVHARLLLALDKVFACEEVLEEVQTLHTQSSNDHSVKAAILRGRVLLKRGLQDEAIQLFEELLTKCLTIDSIHQAGKIERILSTVSQ